MRLAHRPISPSIAALACGPTIGSRFKLALLATFVLLIAGIGIAGGERHEPPDSPPAAADEPKKSDEAKHVDALGDPLPKGAIMRLGTLRHRVQNWYDMPDGKSYLTNRNGEIRRCDSLSGRVLERWSGPDIHRFVGFSPNCKFALFTTDYVFTTGFLRPGQKASQAWKFTLYDLEARRPVWEKSEQLDQNEWNRIDSAGFSPDGKYIVTSGLLPGKLRLWDSATGKQLWEQPNAGQIFESLGFIDGDKTIVMLGNYDHHIHVIDRATGKEIRSFATVDQRQFQGCTLWPDGKCVLVGSYSPKIRVWDLATGKERTPLEGHTKWARSIAFSRAGKTLATAGNDPFALVREWPSGKVVRKIKLRDSTVRQMSISGDGRRLEVLYWGEQALNFYDLASGKQIPSLVDAHQGSVCGVEFTPAGKLVSLGKDASVRTWDLATGKSIRRISVEMDLNSGGFALSRDGKLIATSNNDATAVCLYDRATFKQIKKQSVPRGVTRQLIFSPDGKWLAGADGQGGTIMAWEVATGRVVVKFQGQVVYGTRCTFSPDGKIFAGYQHGRVRFWDTSNWKELPSLTAYSPLGLVFSPDSRMLATAGVEGVRLFEFATMKERLLIPPIRDYPSGTMIFSPSGRWLAWIGNLSMIHVWDLFRGKSAALYTGHDAPVTDIAFAPDERVLASSSDDSTILIWELPKPQAAVAKTPVGNGTAWNDLAGNDAKAAFQAIRILSQAPGVVKSLRERLKTAQPANPKRIAALIGELASPEFARREKATRELEQIGDLAAPALKKSAATSASAEARRRAAQLLDGLSQPVHKSQRLREIRSLELLERIGSDEAKRLLELLSKGAPDAALTKDAKATLERLRK